MKRCQIYGSKKWTLQETLESVEEFLSLYRILAKFSPSAEVPNR